MKYKVLTYGHIFVDMNMLFRGIYETTKPSLLDKDMTIEKLVNTTIDNFNFLGIAEGDYITNLKACTLKEVTLTINEK